MNRVALTGKLTRDPDLHYTESQAVPYVYLGLAVHRPEKDAQGKYQVDFVDVLVWRAQAEHCAAYLKKGRLVAVSGSLRQQQWNDSEGNHHERYVVEADSYNGVQFLDSPNNRRGSDDPGYAAESA